MHVLVYLLPCVLSCGMRLRMCCPGSNDFTSAVGIVVSEGVWDGGYNGGDGSDHTENLQELVRDCYRGDPFINISKFVVSIFVVELF